MSTFDEFFTNYCKSLECKKYVYADDLIREMQQWCKENNIIHLKTIHEFRGEALTRMIKMFPGRRRVGLDKVGPYRQRGWKIHHLK